MRIHKCIRSVYCTAVRVVCVLMIVFLIGITTGGEVLATQNSGNEPKEYYYKGYDVYYNSGKGYLYKSAENNIVSIKCYRTHSYMRCLTYYNSGWIANQHNIITINKSKIVTNTTSGIVSSEIGVNVSEDLCEVAGNLSAELSNSISTAYSTALGLQWDLSKFAHSSYKIAAMGIIDRFRIDYTYGKSPKANLSGNSYAIRSGWGYEIRLVYRW